MVLSGSMNKVGVMGQEQQTKGGYNNYRNESPSISSIEQSSTISILSDLDKVRLNERLLKMIITNDVKNLKDENNFDHSKMRQSSASGNHLNTPDYLKIFENVSSVHLTNSTVENDSVNGKKILTDLNQNQKEMPQMLDSNRVRMMSTYFNYSTIISHTIKDYFEGTSREKPGYEQLLYDNILLYFAYFYFIRNFLLAFIDDLETRIWFGEVERVRPYRQIVMVYTIWSFYLIAILKNFRPDPERPQPLSWLEPFRVFRSESTPKSYGLNYGMLNYWYNYTISLWRFYFFFFAAMIAILSIHSFGLLRFHWNNYPDKTAINWYNSMLLFWTIVHNIWIILTFNTTYVCSVYFISLCNYFRIRYEKVNRDIEVIINKRMKANERVALLHHILIEHNSLCLKVSEYNKFWSSHLMATYFFLVAIVCFCSFQAFFTANLMVVRMFMFFTALLAGFIITRISASASVMSNKAHDPYSRLIRVTFEKYPVELQIQLRMFIQRTSGPTIGFYCLDVFEITYTTYASILAALGQNFLLIVDFVRSYAEVGKEYEDIAFPDLNSLTGGMLNTTVDVFNGISI